MKKSVMLKPLSFAVLILLGTVQPISAQISADSAKKTATDTAKALHGLAFSAYNESTVQGYSRALDYWMQAAELWHRAGKFANEGLAYFNIATVHEDLGELETARQYFHRALQAEAKEPYPEDQAQAHFRLGELYLNLSQPDSALANYDRALRLLEQKFEDRNLEARVAIGIGRTYNLLERLELAETWLTKAMIMFEENGNNAGKGWAYSELMKIKNKRIGRLIAAGQVDSAHAMQQELDQYIFDHMPQLLTPEQLEALRNVNDHDDFFIKLTGLGNDRAGALLLTGQKHARQDRPDSAFAYYRQALALQRANGNRVGESEALLALAKLHHRQIFPPELPQALAYYDSAHAVQAKIQGHAGGDTNRVSLAERDFNLYGEWVLAALALESKIGAEQAALLALAASEQGRGQSLLDLMRGAPQNTGLAGDFVKIRDQLKEGHHHAAVLDYLIATDTLVVWAIPVKGPIKVVRQKLASLSSNIEMPPTKEVLLADLRRNLARNTFVENVAQVRTKLQVDEATPRTSLASSSQPVFSNPDRNIRPKPENGGSKQNGKNELLELAKLLLPSEVLSLLPPSGELVIIPHGALNLLPFAALPINEKDELLGMRYALGYAPSLTTLFQINRTALPGHRSENWAEALVVGSPQMPIVKLKGVPTALQPLTGAEKEAEWVAQKLRTQFLTGAAASEDQIRKRASQAPLMHFATHGLAYGSEEHTRDSFIALAAGNGHDGLLKVSEVVDQLPNLTAELVVLSACQTGLGNVKEAEGTIGLQRAFIAKGSRSVLVSLWSVDDEATEELMKRFYTHWLDDRDRPTKAEALRRAQQEVRATPGFEHPRYWAAFQLVGALN